jgi:hypothetical protein
MQTYGSQSPNVRQSIQKCQKTELDVKDTTTDYILRSIGLHLLRSRILATSMEVDGDADDEDLKDVLMDVVNVTRQ